MLDFVLCYMADAFFASDAVWHLDSKRLLLIPIYRPSDNSSVLRYYKVFPSWSQTDRQVSNTILTSPLFALLGAVVGLVPRLVERTRLL